jgi:glucose-6-phosphate isomerase
VGLYPAAVLGIDVGQLLRGAADMTERFREAPCGENPVLEYVATGHLLERERGMTIRVLSTWGKRLEAAGLWYDQLLAESLGKVKHHQEYGATPFTVVNTRDLHSRGQQHQEGARDKMINTLVVKAAKHPPVMVGHNERNEDDLNQFSRRSFPDLQDAAFKGTMQAYTEAARPTADIVLPTVNEHTIGQLMQMLMLATVVEGRLMKINPYGQPGVEAYKTNMIRILKSIPNLPKGELRDAAKGA